MARPPGARTAQLVVAGVRRLGPRRSVTTEVVHAIASFLLLGLVPAQLDRYQDSAGMDALADLLTVLAGVLAVTVVRRLRPASRPERPA